MNLQKLPIFAALLAMTLTVGAEAHSRRGHGQNPAPEGYDGLMVFIADGIWDPAEAPPVSLSGDYFDETIMGRSAAEKAAQRQAALDYFEADFGVQFFLFPAPAPGGIIGSNATGTIVLAHTYVDPRQNYRAVTISEERVGKHGRTVHDASYAMVVVAPSTLNGTWGGTGGTAVDPGTIAVFGEYLIQGTRHFRQNSRKNIHITWHSAEPIVGAFSPAGFTFDCRLFSDEYGEGISIGRNFVKALPDGRMQITIRNVLTFPLPEWAD